MDPNATLARILECMTDNDAQGMHEAFEDLHEWLNNGGFPPVCKTLGTYRNGETRLTLSPRARRYGGSFAIHSLCSHDTSEGFEFVEYDYHGERVQSWKLGQ